MSRRLQVQISPNLDAQLSHAAKSMRMSKSEWVRRVLEERLQRRASSDPLARLGELNAPTADIDQMLAEIGVGRQSALHGAD